MTNSAPRSLEDLKPGDVLASPRGLGFYKHFGVWVGNGRLYDFSGEARKDVETADIREVSLEEFRDGFPLEFVCHGDGTADDIRRRAAQLQGRLRYNVLTANCEHVAKYVATGRPERWHSTQVAVAVFTTVVAFGIYFLLTIRKS